MVPGLLPLWKPSVCPSGPGRLMPHRDLTIKLGMVTVPYDGSMGREERVHARSNRILTAKGAKQSLEWTQHMQDTE